MRMAEDPQVIGHLERIEELLKALVKCSLAEVISRELTDSRMEELYDLTGTLKVAEIAKKLRCSATTVSETWRRWERLGILVKDGRQYRRVI